MVFYQILSYPISPARHYPASQNEVPRADNPPHQIDSRLVINRLPMENRNCKQRMADTLMILFDDPKRLQRLRIPAQEDSIWWPSIAGSRRGGPKCKPKNPFSVHFRRSIPYDVE